MTIFLSTHTLDIAQELADRIGILDRGQLLGCGTRWHDLRKQANNDGSLEDLFMKITEETTTEAATRTRQQAQRLVECLLWHRLSSLCLPIVSRSTGWKACATRDSSMGVELPRLLIKGRCSG